MSQSQQFMTSERNGKKYMEFINLTREQNFIMEVIIWLGAYVDAGIRLLKISGSEGN